MSKKCPKCESKHIHITEYLHPTDSMATCYGCGYADLVERFPEQSVFDNITKSPEVLAPKLVYFDSSVCDDDGMGYPWCSTLFEDGGHFETEEKAIVATIKELEKELK